MKISIVIVSFNTKNLLKRCLESIGLYPPSVSHETIVVDNASSDGSAEMVALLFPEVRLLENTENLGFAAANNRALRIAGGEFILFLNSDTELLPISLDPLLRHFEMHPETGVVGPTEQFKNGNPYPTICPSPDLSFIFFNDSGLRKRFYKNKLINPYRLLWERAQVTGEPVEVGWLSGASLMIRRQVLDQIGFFDEEYFFYMEETDLCERARKAGWKVKFIPESRVIHHGGQSTRKAMDGLLALSGAMSQLYFFKKHRGLIELIFLRIFFFVEYSLKLVIVKVGDPRRWAYRETIQAALGFRKALVKKRDRLKR